MAAKSPQLLTVEQRLSLTSIPQTLSEQQIIDYYTLCSQDLAFIEGFRGAHNRVGVAMQLCSLRFPGRFLRELASVPDPVVTYVAGQLNISFATFADYGAKRSNTFYDHLDSIRETYGYRNYGWSDVLRMARYLVPLALESDEALSLIEDALDYMRRHKIIAPAITTIESLVWRVQRIALRSLYHRLTCSLNTEQCQQLDDLLRVETSPYHICLLAWLGVPPNKPSSKGMYHLLDRLAFVKTLQMPQLPENVHPNRVRELAQQCRGYKAQHLFNFKSARRRYAYLVAYTHELPFELTDQVLDMFDRWLGDLMRKGRNKQKHKLYTNVGVLNRTLNTLVDVACALLEAHENETDPFQAVFAITDVGELTEVVTRAKQHMRPADMDFRDLLEHTYLRRRKAMLQMYRDLSFTAIGGDSPAIEALDHVILLADQFNKRVGAIEQVIKQQVVTAPTDHLRRTRWKRHALVGNQINPNYYELAGWQRLKEEVRAGDIVVKGSRRYQPFDDYLLTQSRWEELKATNQTRLAVTNDPKPYLVERQQQIKAMLTTLPKLLVEDTNLSLDDDGIVHLSPDEKTVPDEVATWRRRIYSMMPSIQLADLIVEVNGWTGCLQPFVHLTTGETPTGLDKRTLIAATMAKGLNLSKEAMARASDFSSEQLAYSEEWYIRKQALRESLTMLDNFVLHHPYSRHWGGGMTSSSDGMRMRVNVDAANALYNARYFHFKRGITIVTHTADIWMPFDVDVAHDAREALHVVDALCHHETDFDIHEHYTDTGGYSYHVFGLCRLLGFRFAPRIRSITKQYLFTVDPVSPPPELQSLIKGEVDSNLICPNWEKLCRMASSIRHGTVSASLLMRKLAAYPRQHDLGYALREIGKLERTFFVLQYLQDKALRQRIRRGLNKGEGVHALARALAFGRLGELNEREIYDQLNRASCLMLLVAMISAWNTVYLDKAVKTLRSQGVKVPEEYLIHISPLGWKHINFLGKYDIDLEQTYPLDRLRALHYPPFYL